MVVSAGSGTRLAYALGVFPAALTPLVGGDLAPIVNVLFADHLLLLLLSRRAVRPRMLPSSFDSDTGAAQPQAHPVLRRESH